VFIRVSASNSMCVTVISLSNETSNHKIYVEFHEVLSFYTSRSLLWDDKYTKIDRKLITSRKLGFISRHVEFPCKQCSKCSRTHSCDATTPTAAGFIIDITANWTTLHSHSIKPVLSIFFNNRSQPRRNLAFVPEFFQKTASTVLLFLKQNFNYALS